MYLSLDTIETILSNYYLLKQKLFYLLLSFQIIILFIFIILYLFQLLLLLLFIVLLLQHVLMSWELRYVCNIFLFGHSCFYE